jgi:hypothetical protein
MRFSRSAKADFWSKVMADIVRPRILPVLRAT